MRLPSSVGFLFFCVATLAHAAEPAPAVDAFAADTEVATSGFYRLTWETPDGVSVELQEASTDDFADARPLYTGTDRAYFVSGKSDGDYFYRIRTRQSEPSAWTATVKVAVDHHPLWRAWLIFGLGAFIFLSTLWLVFGGGRARS